jgi:hypothetical protein
MDVTIFVKPKFRNELPTFLSILFLKDKSTTPVQTQGDGLSHKHEYQAMGPLWAIFEAAYHFPLQCILNRSAIAQSKMEIIFIA